MLQKERVFMEASEKFMEIDITVGLVSDLLVAQMLLLEALDDEMNLTPEGEPQGMVCMAKGRAAMYSAALSGMNASLVHITDDISDIVRASVKEQATGESQGAFNDA